MQGREGRGVAILSETQSRRLNVELAELALLRRGACPFHVTVVSPPQTAPVPVRSTGASHALQGLGPAVKALSASAFVVDLTVEGMLHAPELPDIIADGARAAHGEQRTPRRPGAAGARPGALTERVKEAVKRIRGAKEMRVTSDAGSDLRVELEGAPSAGVWGYCDRPKTVAHWPGGIVVAFPAAGSVQGRLVIDTGDVNLTFKRYLESPVALTIEDDYVTRIEGEGTDAELFRRYWAAWDDREAYATSHVGWGLNEAARYEALTMYDQRDFNGTELRAFAGNFLYSTGANEFANRHTLGHFDLPMRNCTVSLDGEIVIEAGRLVDSRI